MGRNSATLSLVHRGPTGPGELDEALVPLHPFGRCEPQQLLDARPLGVLEWDQPDVEIEAAGADQLDQTLERRGLLAGLDAGDGRLSRARPAGELRLSGMALRALGGCSQDLLRDRD